MPKSNTGRGTGTLQEYVSFDIDQLSASVGRRYQDDAIWNLTHNNVMTNFDFELDQRRIEPVRPIGEYYPPPLAGGVINNSASGGRALPGKGILHPSLISSDRRRA